MLKKFALAFAIGLLGCGLAHAEYPERPIKMIAPIAPGGLTDSLARIVADNVGKRLGQTVIVDNRSGAGGAVGMLAAAKSEPDGYTLAFVYQGVASVNPVLYKSPAYDTLRDFKPVSLVGSFAELLVVDPALQVSSTAEFIALAKSKPGALNYASAGVATTSHLAMELLKSQAGIDLAHVAYRGESPAIVDVVAGRVSALFATPAVANPLAAAGQVKVLGISTPEADPDAPQIAPIARTVPGFQVEGWYGVLVPAAVDPAIITKLNAAIIAALSEPAVVERLKAIGVTPRTSSPDQLGTLIADEMQKWRKVIADAKITVD
jgi:tripartite-type tricarboxylate transporter receptor subunit TctC